MKRIVSTLTLAAVVAVAPAHAKQPVTEGWDLSVMGSYLITDNDRNDVDYGLGMHLALSHPLSRRWGVDLAIYGHGLERDEVSGQHWQYGAGPDLLYHLGDGRVRPYLLGGAGVIYTDSTSGYDTDLYWNLGGGLKVDRVWQNLGLRLDARYISDRSKDGAGNESYSDVKISVGLTLPLFREREVVERIQERERIVEREVRVEVPVQIPVAFAESEVLHGVTFDFDSARLTPNARTILRSVAERLAYHHKTEVEISGHSDSVGSRAYNQRLSERRAEAVREFLIELGIAPERMTAVGFGPDQPIASNETDEGREVNRRIEIKRTN
ncbi:MAG: OmpA family protein [Marinobacter sp.]|nr:OmpA family protein [Marinobacter sp.]